MTVQILFPPGRIVQGSPGRFNESKPRPGEPVKVYKTGEHQGQPLRSWFFAVAIPKQPGQQHWAQTVLPAGVQPGTKDADMYGWGMKIYQEGAQAFPSLYQGRDFAWKVEDGDDPTPNKAGRKNSETEGMAGHWIVKFATSAWNGIRCYTRENGAIKPLEDPTVIKTGYYVQVSATVEGNGVKPGTSETPGLYVNPDLVLMVGYGPEIFTGPNADEVFGGVAAALPAGASVAPIGVSSMPIAVPPAAVAPPAAPLNFAALAHPGAAVAPPPVAVAAPVFQPTVVTPNPAVLAVPPAPAAVPPAPVRRMTAKAGGATYEQFINSGQGWTDALLVQQGYMEA